MAKKQTIENRRRYLLRRAKSESSDPYNIVGERKTRGAPKPVSLAPVGKRPFAPAEKE